MLGSLSEAEDAVQEAWLRLSRSDTDAVDNLGGWLTTVVGRVCLDMLRARRVAARGLRRQLAARADRRAIDDDRDPEHEALLADSVGLALLVVLETLTPAERLAFVLHDMFAVPFDEIAPIVDRSPAAARQLASRARRRVRGAAPNAGRRPRAAARGRRRVPRRRRAPATSRRCVAVLDPDVVFRVDAGAAAGPRAAADQRRRGGRAQVLARGAPLRAARAAGDRQRRAPGWSSGRPAGRSPSSASRSRAGESSRST